MGPEGAKALAPAIAANGGLTTIGKDGLNLKSTQLGAEGWGAIIGAICGSTVSKISSIDLSGERIGPEGAELIGKALSTSVNGVLTILRLGDNPFGSEGYKHLSEGLRANTSLKELAFHNHYGNEEFKMGSAGAVFIADALRVNGGLTKLE